MRSWKIGPFLEMLYCWWTKSFTTKDDEYAIIYRVSTIPGGAGFLPSTVCYFFASFFCCAWIWPSDLFYPVTIKVHIFSPWGWGSRDGKMGWKKTIPSLKLTAKSSKENRYQEDCRHVCIIFWVAVSNICFYFHPCLGKIPILTYIFQMGWNHELVFVGTRITLGVL